VLRLAMLGRVGLPAVESNSTMNLALNAVVRAGVPVLSFELEGARLSDAFLKMTRQGAA